MVKLTAVIITLNEEKNISKCLESLMGVVDEIIVVDSFSTDATELISLKFGARFIRHTFEGHIEQKNFAASQASNDFILSLDADEVLSDQLIKSILEVKKNWKYDGYSFKRLTNFGGKWIKHGSWYPSKKLRLFDRRKGKWGGRNPHDRFILDQGATQLELKGDLLHYSYPSIDEHIKQINYFSGVIAREYYKENIRIAGFAILYHAFWRFFRDYFIKLGFMDGLYGLIISVNSSYETYLKYTKLKLMLIERSESGNQKICFVNSSKSWGGGEKWHFDISKRLSEKGYDIILVSSPGSELNKRAEINQIPGHTFRISNLSFLNPLKLFLFSKFLRRQKTGVLFINLSADLKLAGIAGKIAGVKKIIYRRGSAIPVKNTMLNRYLFRKIVSCIIANSEETRRTILHNNPRFVRENKLKVIYNGLDLKSFDEVVARQVYTRNGNEILIGNAGRLSEEKGQFNLIGMAKILKSKGFSFKILIAGEGKLESKLREYASEQGVGEEIIFLGFINDIRSFTETIDIFVLTSFYEGFGYVLVEAMAGRKPVVAFDISSSAEIVENGRTGLLVEKGNIEQLADRVALLMSDPEQRQTMGSFGRRRVEEFFTIEKALSGIEKLISSSGQNE